MDRSHHKEPNQLVYDQFAVRLARANRWLLVKIILFLALTILWLILYTHIAVPFGGVYLVIWSM